MYFVLLSSYWLRPCFRSTFWTVAEHVTERSCTCIGFYSQTNYVHCTEIGYVLCISVQLSHFKKHIFFGIYSFSELKYFNYNKWHKYHVDLLHWRAYGLNSYWRWEKVLHTGTSLQYMLSLFHCSASLLSANVVHSGSSVNYSTSQEGRGTWLWGLGVRSIKT